MSICGSEAPPERWALEGAVPDEMLRGGANGSRRGVAR